MKPSLMIGLYLAAGKSVRMGCNKLALPLHGATLGSLALRAALISNLDHVLVLTKKDDCLDWIPRVLLNADISHKLHQIKCERSIEGQSETICSGIRRAQALGAECVIIMLADQPYVTDKILNRLLACYVEARKEHRGVRCIGTVSDGITRPPMLFSCQVFNTLLLRLHGDEGVRTLFRSGELTLDATVEVPTADMFCDIDTMSAYHRALQSDFSRFES